MEKIKLKIWFIKESKKQLGISWYRLLFKEKWFKVYRTWIKLIKKEGLI